MSANSAFCCLTKICRSNFCLKISIGWSVSLMLSIAYVMASVIALMSLFVGFSCFEEFDKLFIVKY